MASETDGPAPAPSSTHRLATVSASQALQNLKARGPRSISTGLPQLDEILKPNGAASQATINGKGGLARGHVAEIYGPPGVGKTAFGIQACVNALKAGSFAIWIDCAAPLVQSRLATVLDAAITTPTSQEDAPPRTDETSVEIRQRRFQHFTTPTLAHLLALLVVPPASFPPQNTGIIVVDSLSTLLDNAYPRFREEKRSANKSDAAKWASSRKYAVLGDLLSKLEKLAALHDLTILLTCHTVTRMRPGAGALLVPAISGLEWDSSMSTRLVLFRDWPPHQFQSTNPSELERLSRLRFVGVEKAGGVSIADENSVNIVPFTIEETGLAEVNLQAANVAIQHLTSPARPAKRTYVEIADSEDEDGDLDDIYDWVEAEELAAEGLVNESVLMKDQLATNITKSNATDEAIT